MELAKVNDWVEGLDRWIPPQCKELSTSFLDDEVVLFDDASGKTYRLNQTALAVWQQCDGTVAIRDIAKQLTQQFEVELETALDHVEQLVAMFAEAGLFEQSGSTRPGGAAT